MLRIMEEKAKDGSTTLRLDGRVVSQWVEVLRQSCDQVFQNEAQKDGQNNGNGNGKRQLILDLTGVSFADYEGVRLLRQLEQGQVTLMNCSPFLQEQMKQTANRLFTDEPASQ